MLTQRLISEALWLLIGIVVAAAVLAPVLLSQGTPTFVGANVAIIVGAVFVIRLLFFHRESPLLAPKWAKGVACIAVVPALLFTVLAINEVQNLVDAYGFQGLFGETAFSESAIRWGRYVRNELILFASALIIGLVALPVVLIIALWRQVNATQRGAPQP